MANLPARRATTPVPVPTQARPEPLVIHNPAELYDLLLRFRSALPAILEQRRYFLGLARIGGHAPTDDRNDREMVNVVYHAHRICADVAKGHGMTGQPAMRAGPVGDLWATASINDLMTWVLPYTRPLVAVGPDRQSPTAAVVPSPPTSAISRGDADQKPIILGKNEIISLRTLLAKKTTTEESTRLTRDQIMTAAHSQVSEGDFKKSLRRLVKVRGFLASERGPNGGYWFTPEGFEYASKRMD